MSNKHGKTELSFRKVKSSSSASNTATISKDVLFAHQTSGGETTIDLNSLVIPSTMLGFTNPTLPDLLSANIKKNANNMVVISSAKGALQIKADFFIPTNDKINLNFIALPNEVFTFQLRTTEAVNEILSGAPYVATGTLLAGQTDIPLGQAFRINKNSSQQIGEFTVKIDGVQQFRNVGNVTAAPAADGNYEEVVGGGAGLTNLVRLNNSLGLDVAYSIESLGPILDSNDTGLQQKIEAVEGQIDQIIPTLASLAGVPETDFQATPNSVDLKAFADKLFQATTDIATLTSQLVAVNNKEVDSITKETITYTGFTSRNGSSFTLLPTEFVNSSNSLVTVTNTDHTRYTFDEAVSFTAHVGYNGSASNGSFSIRLYDSSNVIKIQSTGITDNGGGAQSVSLNTEAVAGDYLVYQSSLNQGNVNSTNLSVTATKIVKTKISDL